MLTIYIPTYNAAPYLQRLFDSFADLPPSRVEILFVNDASTDKSLEMLEEFAKARENTRVLNNEKNLGIGATANRAIDAITNEYFLRCNADDEVIAEGILVALDQAEAQNLDLVLHSYVDRNVKGHEKEVHHKIGDQTLLEAHWCDPSFVPSLWTTTIKTEFVRKQGVRFVESRRLIGEDTVWAAELFAGVKASQVAFTDKLSYLYHRRPGSASRPDRDQKAHFSRYAEGLILRLLELERLGEIFVSQGYLTRAQASAGLCDFRTGQIMRALRKSGQSTRALAEYHRIRMSYGVSRQMRQEFFRCLVRGIWRFFLP